MLHYAFLCYAMICKIITQRSRSRIVAKRRVFTAVGNTKFETELIRISIANALEIV